MKREIVQTGGLKELNITKENRKRWESEDTEATKEFKEELRFWKQHPYKYWFRKNKKRLGFGLGSVFVIFLIIVLFL